MKKIFLPVVAIASLVAYCGVAKKKAGTLNCVQGKVIRISCASYVVQALNNDTLGVDGWKAEPDTTKVYDNVFDVANKCKLPAGIKAGDTIYFNVKPVTPSDCISCMMFDNPPAAKYDIVDVATSPCE